MRLLLQFILLSSFFFAPFKSKAGGVTNAEATQLKDCKTAKTAIIHYLVSDDHTAVISNTGQRNISNTRYRPFSYAHFYSTDCFIKKTTPLPGTKYFVIPHLYCQSIGLKLIFPKHYFW
jgi:hypothetical protein